ALAPTLASLFAAPVLVGLALGIGYPVLMGMSIERVDDSERTIAMGLHQAIYAIGMFAGPAISGIVADHIGLQPMFGITAFASLALGLLGTMQFKVQGSKFQVEPRTSNFDQRI
ncbi:MAG: MFS transporter, partial [Chloroflexota bacterium]